MDNSKAAAGPPHTQLLLGYRRRRRCRGIRSSLSDIRPQSDAFSSLRFSRTRHRAPPPPASPPARPRPDPAPPRTPEPNRRFGILGRTAPKRCPAAGAGGLEGGSKSCRTPLVSDLAVSDSQVVDLEVRSPKRRQPVEFEPADSPART